MLSPCQDRSLSPFEDDPPPSPYQEIYPPSSSLCRDPQPPSIPSSSGPTTSPPSTLFDSQPTTPPPKPLPHQPTTPKKNKKKKKKVKPEQLVPLIAYKWPEPPAPTTEAGPAQYVYGAPELQRRIVYTEKMRNLHLIPRSEMFFELYETTARSALENEKVNKEEAKECKDRMHRYDHFLEWNAFLRYEPEDLQIQLESKFLKLKQLEYLARYGDYVGSELQFLKDIATFKKSENYKQFHTYWTTVDRKMCRERHRLDRGRDEVVPDNLPILKAIWITGAAFKLKAERVEFPIHYYTHIRSVWKLMKTGRWHRLAMALYFDEMELRMMISPTQDMDIAKMSTLIRVMKQALFGVGPRDKRTPDTWIPSKAAVKFVKYLCSDNSKEEKEKWVESHINEMVQLSNEHYAKRQLEIAMIKEASKDLSLEIAHPESVFDKTILPRRQILEIAVGIPPKTRGLESLLRD